MTIAGITAVVSEHTSAISTNTGAVASETSRAEGVEAVLGANVAVISNTLVVQATEIATNAEKYVCRSGQGRRG